MTTRKSKEPTLHRPWRVLFGVALALTVGACGEGILGEEDELLGSPTGEIPDESFVCDADEACVAEVAEPVAEPGTRVAASLTDGVVRTVYFRWTQGCRDFSSFAPANGAMASRYGYKWCSYRSQWWGGCWWKNGRRVHTGTAKYRCGR